MQTADCNVQTQYANCNILLEYANCNISLRFNSTFGFRFRFKFKQTAICRLQCANWNMQTVICKLKKYIYKIGTLFSLGLGQNLSFRFGPKQNTKVPFNTTTSVPNYFPQGIYLFCGVNAE